MRNNIMLGLHVWMKQNNIKKSISLLSSLSLLFFTLIGLDFFPLLRGPIGWQWTYLFINTLSKIFPSLLFIGMLLYLFSFFDRKKDKEIPRYEKILLPLLVILGFLLQLSVIYFSRAGIFVLLARTIEPVSNGYFTAALDIHNVATFLTQYNQLLPTFPLHPSQHPPGAILLYYVFDRIFSFVPIINHYVNTIRISTKSIHTIWFPLLPNQKATALFVGFFMPFFSSAIAIPLYYLFKLYGDTRIALRGIFLYLFLPSVVLFTPLPDVLFSVFSISSFFFFVLAFKKNNLRYFLSAAFF